MVVLAEEVIVIDLAEEVHVVLPWIDVQGCRRWSSYLTDCYAWCKLPRGKSTVSRLSGVLEILPD